MVTGNYRPGNKNVTLDGMRRELTQQARITARRTAIEWESQVKRTEPVATGQMRTKTAMNDRQTSTGFQIVGEVDTDYAEYVSAGTRPHVIRPRNAKALRFKVGGKTVFATRVNHPGTQPNAFWTQPLSRLPDTIRRIWAQVTA